MARDLDQHLFPLGLGRLASCSRVDLVQLRHLLGRNQHADDVALSDLGRPGRVVLAPLCAAP